MMRKDIFISLTFYLIYFYLTDVLCLETRSSCSNNTLTLECPDNQRIGIKRVFYGAKKDRNCSTKGRSYSEDCCTRGYGDCLVYNNDIQVTLNSKCSGKASCQVPTPSVSTGDFCTDKARKTTDYMTVLYECVPDSMIIGLCSNDERSGKVVYLSNNEYPVPIKGKKNCTCTATTNSEYGIVVSVIDVLFPSSGRTCMHRMKIKDSSTIRGTDIGCSWPVYGFRSLYSSRSPNVTFNLITGEGDNNGYIWMELKPRLQTDMINVRCGDPKKLETTMEPTTKPSTSTTTETTIATTIKVTMTKTSPSSTTTMAPVTTKVDTSATTTTTSATMAPTTTTNATMAPNKTGASTMIPTTKQSTSKPTNTSPSTKMTTKTMGTEQSTTRDIGTTEVTKPKTSQMTTSNQMTKTTSTPGNNAGKRGEQAVTTAKSSGGEMTTDKGDEQTAKQKVDECQIDYCYEISRPMSLIMVGSFPNTTFLDSVCKPLESSSSCLKDIRSACEYSQQMVEFKQLEEEVEVLEQLRTIVCSEHRTDLEAFENCYSTKAKTEIAGCQSLSKPPMQSDGQRKMETETEQCMRLQKLYKCIVDATSMCGDTEAKAAETITKKIQAVISGQNTMECPTSAATSIFCDNSWIFIAALMYIFLRL